eukprot:6471521-Amphidinium_carterae.2
METIGGDRKFHEVQQRCYSDGTESWPKAHAAFRKKHALTDLPKWSDGRDLRGVASGRATDNVDICFQMWFKKTEQLHTNSAEVDCPLVMDLSQSAMRVPAGLKLRSLVANSCYYHFRRNRVLFPIEYMSCLGWPLDRLKTPNISTSGLRDLSGESMALPAVGLACMCVLTCMKDSTLWRQSQV